jgi:hypothetical protein
MKRLVIDDKRIFEFPPSGDSYDHNTYAKNFVAGYDCLRFLSPWDELYLDNDLGLGQKEGRDIANWLEDQAVHGKKIPIGKIIITTANPVAEKAIYNALNKHYNVEYLTTQKFHIDWENEDA